MIDSTQIIRWNRRGAPTANRPGQWSLNQGNLPFIRWQPRVVTATGSRAGLWSLNQGNLPYFPWLRSPGAVTPPQHQEGSFLCAGKGAASFIGQLIPGGTSAFSCRGSGTARWTGSLISGSDGFFAQGSATADWLGTVPIQASFSAAGHSTARWDADRVKSGLFTASGSSTALWLVGLDAVLFPCLTGGKSPVLKKPNFVH